MAILNGAMGEIQTHDPRIRSLAFRKALSLIYFIYYNILIKP